MSDGMQGEPTTWSVGLIGFYAACAAVGIGAAIAAIVLVVFPEEPFAGVVSTFGILLTVAGGLGAWRFLKAARCEL